jgi:hypothetical protein
MVGKLMHGENHFVVRGPLADRDAARALIRHSTCRGQTNLPPSFCLTFPVYDQHRRNNNCMNAFVKLFHTFLSPNRPDVASTHAARRA